MVLLRCPRPIFLLSLTLSPSLVPSFLSYLFTISGPNSQRRFVDKHRFVDKPPFVSTNLLLFFTNQVCKKRVKTRHMTYINLGLSTDLLCEFRPLCSTFYILISSTCLFRFLLLFILIVSLYLTLFPRRNPILLLSFLIISPFPYFPSHPFSLSSCFSINHSYPFFTAQICVFLNVCFPSPLLHFPFSLTYCLMLFSHSTPCFSLNHSHLFSLPDISVFFSMSVSLPSPSFPLLFDLLSDTFLDKRLPPPPPSHFSRMRLP